MLEPGVVSVSGVVAESEPVPVPVPVPVVSVSTSGAVLSEAESLPPPRSPLPPPLEISPTAFPIRSLPASTT